MYYTEKEAKERNFKTFDNLLKKCHDGDLAHMMEWLCSSDLSKQFSSNQDGYKYFVKCFNSWSKSKHNIEEV
jgi:hypothetical protein